jgi:hypothetical protein
MVNSNSAAAESTGEFVAVSDAELVSTPASTSERILRAEAPLLGSSNEPVLVSSRETELGDASEVLEHSPTRDVPDAERPTSETRLSRAALAARVETAMAASERTENALDDLLRTAKFLSASISAVRGANAELVRELEVLCALVDGDGAERMALERRIQRLERAVDDTGREAHRDREFLVSEHDSFIATLIGDHERELQELRRRLAETPDNPRGAKEPEEAADLDDPTHPDWPFPRRSRG